MKKILISITLLISAISWSQDKAHEIKLNALRALVTPAIGINYEYAANENSSLGLSTFIRLDSPDDDYMNFAIGPYYRQHFFENLTPGDNGFYIDGMLQYSTGKDESRVIEETQVVVTENYSDLGIAFGAGYKLVSNNGFTIDAGGAVGRNFKLDSNSPDFFFRWGINLGYRFF